MIFQFIFECASPALITFTGEAPLRVATVAVHAGAGVLALVDVRAVAPGVVWPTQKYLLLQI